MWSLSDSLAFSIAFVKQWVAEREQEIAEKYAKGAQEPSIEDLEKECEERISYFRENEKEVARRVKCICEG